MTWSIWQSLKAREKPKTPGPDEPAPGPPTLRILLEIFGTPAAPRGEEPATPDPPKSVTKEA